MAKKPNFDKNKIKIKDITSQGMSLSEYILKNNYSSAFESYQPDVSVMEKISATISSFGEKLTIVAFGAVWCGDCKIQIPRLAKIIELLGDDKVDGKIIAGIKTKPSWERKSGEFIWKSPPSPPESVDKRFSIYHIPAIYIFNKNGDCIGKIDEGPEHTESLEGDLLHYMREFYP